MVRSNTVLNNYEKITDETSTMKLTFADAFMIVFITVLIAICIAFSINKKNVLNNIT